MSDKPKRPEWVGSDGKTYRAECFDGDSWGRHAWLPDGDEMDENAPLVCIHCGDTKLPEFSHPTAPEEDEAR